MSDYKNDVEGEVLSINTPRQPLKLAKEAIGMWSSLLLSTPNSTWGIEEAPISEAHFAKTVRPSSLLLIVSIAVIYIPVNC